MWACQSWPSRSVLLGTSALHRGPRPSQASFDLPPPLHRGRRRIVYQQPPPNTHGQRHLPPLFPSNGIAAPGSSSTARPLGRLATARTSHWWGFQPRPTPAWYTSGWRTRAHASRQPPAGAVSPPSSPRSSLLPSLHLPLPSSCNSPRVGLPL